MLRVRGAKTPPMARRSLPVIIRWRKVPARSDQSRHSATHTGRSAHPTKAAMLEYLSIYLNACARCAWLVMLALDEASEALAD